MSPTPAGHIGLKGMSMAIPDSYAGRQVGRSGRQAKSGDNLQILPDVCSSHK